MWVDLVPIGPALSAFPTHVGIRAGAAETVKLTVTTAHLRRSGSPEHRLQLTWNIIPAPGRPLQGPARGTAQLKVRVETPRPAVLCPSPRCGARVAGDASMCPACGAWLVTCPVCGTLNSRLSGTCSANPSHRLRSTGPWPCLG